MDIVESVKSIERKYSLDNAGDGYGERVKKK